MVIPCYNCADLLDLQLHALARQEFDQTWEIIVADNGSSDDPARVVAEHARRGLNVTYVQADGRQGASHARNAGCQAASGEVFLFCDADDEAAPDWLQAMHRAMQERDLVTGPVDYHQLNDNSAAPKALRKEPRVWDWLPLLPHALGGNMAIRRELHETIGGFDESLLAAEDIDYSWRAQLAGADLHFAEDAVIYYRLRDSAAAIFLQMVRNGEYSVQLYKKYLDAGADPKSLREGVRGWVVLLRQWHLLRRPETRARWVRQFGLAAGRLKGSIKHRIVAI